MSRNGLSSVLGISVLFVLVPTAAISQDTIEHGVVKLHDSKIIHVSREHFGQCSGEGDRG